jgi:hypothetical protein
VEERIMRLSSLIIGVIALSAVVLAGRSPAFAQSFTFVSLAQVTCWDDTEGFDVNLQPLPVPTPTPAGTHFMRRTHAVNTGTSTFHSDGTFTSQGQASSIRSSGTLFGETQSTCTGTFVFNPANQTLTTSSSCTFQDTIPNTDSGTITNIHGVLQLTPDAKLVHSGPHPPVVETVNVNVSGGGSFAFSRLCTRAGTETFLH